MVPDRCLRSNWRIVAAVVGCLTLGNGHQQPQHPETTQQEAAAHQRPTQSSIAQLPRPEEYKPHCQHPRNQDEASVCAALIQANAAQSANVISQNSLKWNKFALGALALTLFATAWAAWAASAAAQAATKSVELFASAEAGNLVPGIAEFRQDAIEIYVRNAGRSIVSIIHADMIYRERLPIEAIDVPLTLKYTASGLGIDVGQHHSFGLQTIPSQSRIIFIIGGVVFRDTFGKFDYTPIALRLDRQAMTYTLEHGLDFGKWQRFCSSMTKGKKPKLE